MPADLSEPVVLELNGQDKVTDMIVGVQKGEKVSWSMGIYVMKKAFLQNILNYLNYYN